MTGVHIAVGSALIAANLVAGVWGGAAWLRKRPSLGFWYALRVAQVTVVLQAMIGLILVFTGSAGPGIALAAAATALRAADAGQRALLIGLGSAVGLGALLEAELGDDGAPAQPAVG